MLYLFPTMKNNTPTGGPIKTKATIDQIILAIAIIIIGAVGLIITW